MRINIPAPSPKQELFLEDEHRHVGFGGARGGGKSWAVRVKADLLALRHAGIRICIVRRTYPELIENHIKPMKELMMCGTKGSPCKYNDSRKEMKFSNGSEILFRYCNAENDLNNFQGVQFDVIFIDEATQLKQEWIEKICACVRGVNNFPKRVYYTMNPGGASHGYFKRLFIDKAYEVGEHPEEYSFIQSLVTDNKALMEADPEYIKMLEKLPPKLRDAWLNGRWDVFEGAFFEEFRQTPDPQKCHEAGITVEEALQEHRWTHVIKPFDIPKSWKIYRSYDFGSSKPFSFGWWAVSEDNIAYRILEFYGCTGTPNEGVRWTPSEQFKKAAEIEREHPYLRGRKIQGVADPSIWDGSRGVAIIEEAEKQGIYFNKGVNDRIPGWMQVRERMLFNERGEAMLYIFENCKDAIRTIPLMMFDDHKPEDLSTEMEDHICDEIRYFAMCRPIAPRQIVEQKIPMHDPLNQYIDKGTYNKAIIRRI